LRAQNIFQLPRVPLAIRSLPIKPAEILLPHIPQWQGVGDAKEKSGEKKVTGQLWVVGGNLKRSLPMAKLQTRPPQ